jgi:cell fate regulator YaaT (PSP1 superfamily)
MKYLIRARYSIMGYYGDFISRSDEYSPHEQLVLKTPRGTEIGSFMAVVKEIDDRGGESDGKVIGIASEQELSRMEKTRNIDQAEEQKFCRDTIREKGLKMNLKFVEHILGGERVIFYFTAEKRVDFRELVRILADRYKTRIEMKQIGARDEAALLADCGICGRVLCCKDVLTKIKPVSMRRAKMQTSTLDPAKVSGRCGRLKCCFRYEYETYNDLRSGLPSVGDIVKTDEITGEVIEQEILTRKVKVIAEGERDILQIPVEDIVEVVKR